MAATIHLKRYLNGGTAYKFQNWYLAMNYRNLVLALALFINPLSAQQAPKSTPVLKKALRAITFPLSPTEVTHSFEIVRDAQNPYTLDSRRITLLQDLYEQNFKIRSHLAKATYAVTAGSLIWLGYKWGFFDWMLPKAHVTISEIPAPVAPTLDDPTKMLDYLKAQEVYSKVLCTRIAALESVKKDVQWSNWLVDNAKNIGWSGVTIATSLIVQSKWYAFFGYALTEPSFKWFLSHHSIISTIDRLKRSVQALSSTHMPAEFSNEYHMKALVPAVIGLIRNTEQFIAFIEFYLPMLEEDVVKKEAMDGIGRYLFNITNDFLMKIDPILIDPAAHASLIPIIDEYRADVATFINRCKVFEEEFFPAV